MQALRSTRWLILLAGTALVCVAGAVFFRILRFEFIEYDVSTLVVDNPHIRGLTWENLKNIFTTRCITSYYPVRALSFAVDYHFWGLNPAGFKLTNLLIHLANVLLVFWLVLRLFRHSPSVDDSTRPWWDVYAAAFPAGVFAIHPVVVEPVTWVAGREELLMTLGALGCIHFHLTARRLDQEGGHTARALACYVSAVLCCAFACLSNAVAAVIPLLITAWDVVTLARPKLWKILSGTAALWLIGVATMVIKMLGPKAAISSEAGAMSAQRLMALLQVYWLNLKTLLWPTNLALSRSPIEPESFLQPGVILGAMAVVVTCVILWKLRGRKPVFLGLLWFILALAPSSQIIVHHVHRADRFLYLPLVGLAVAAGAGLKLPGVSSKKRITVSVVVVSSALLVLGLLSARQVRTWKTGLSVWENCVQADPENAFARLALSERLAKAGQTDRAIHHHQIARQLDYNDAEAMRSAALRAAMVDGRDLRDYALAVRLATRACELTDWEDSKYRHALAVAYGSYAKALVTRGELGQAIYKYYRALDADPDYPPALFQLAVVLATCTDPQLRNPDEAVRLAERGCRLADPPDPAGLMILAAAYAGAGWFEEAVRTIEKAIGLAQAAGDAKLVDQLQSQLRFYRERLKDHQPP